MINGTMVIRIDPNGDPERGMTDTIPAVDVIEGNSEKRYHRFFVTNRKTMSEMRVSVVEGHAYAEKVVDYPCDELCIVVEGSVAVTDETGHTETFEKGDCLFTPQGFTGIWRQSEKFKKIAMTVCR